MSMISDLVDRLRVESKSMGKYGVDYMSTLLMDASNTIIMLSEKARADRPQGEWIPCSERLPSEKSMYLVTSREKATAEEFGFDLDDVEVKKMRFDEDGWRIPKHIPEWINGVVHTTVLAWMPLPKPYGEREGE